MKERYLPVIVDALGRTYENCKYNNLADAVDALKKFVNAFSNSRDDKIADMYVLNIITGKQVRP